MEKTTSNYNTDCRNDKSDSKDVVDFIKTSNINNNNNNNDNDSNNYNNNKLTLANATDNYYRKNGPCNDNNSAVKSTIRNSVATISSKKKKSDESNEKKAIASTKERLSLFSFNKKFSQKHSNSTKSTVAATDAIKIANAKSDNTNTNSITNTTVPAPKKLATVATNLVEAGVGEKLVLLPPESASSTARPHRFVKSSSIARFLGHTYHAKKFEKVASAAVAAAAATEEEGKQHRLSNDNKFHTYAGRRRRRLNEPYLERFRQCSKDDGDIANAEATLDLRDLCSGSRHDLHSLEHPEEGDRNVDFGTKAMRTISRGLGKLWWRRSNSVEISTPDPEYKVCYLGNVLTGWAKGEGCVEKQLNTLWRNYTQNTKPDVVMRIKVCASGLKATTRQHGLTEYWANRITHCCAPKNYPRVFCWIYRHEGRKLKHELRCHAVLCSKEKIVRDICSTLKENLECALREFKRDKILKQNARLSLANAAYDNPSLPRRKILLSVGGNNYRPPLERSKSAPKLMAIEEAIGEEDGDEVEETNEPEMKSCCQKDSLYPAMTLGRRRCRRGHSIRRTGKTRPVLCTHFADGDDCPEQIRRMDAVAATGSSNSTPSKDTAQRNAQCDTGAEEKRHSFDSDDSDDFEKLLKGHNYDSSNSLTNELLPYFDLQLHKQTSSSLGSLDDLKQDNEDGSEPLSLLPTINSNPSADPAAEYEFVDDSASKQFDAEPVGLRRDGVCSDGEEDYLDDDMCFRQASILNLLHRNSMRKMAQLALSSDESSIETNASPQYHHQGQSSISSNASSTLTSVSAADTAADSHPNSQHGSETRRKSEHGQSLDSDEGSISSGCETASTVTANQDDTSLRYRHSKQQPSLQRPTTADLQLHAEDEAPITVEDIYRRLESRLHGRHGSDATTFSSSSSMTLKMGSSPTPSLEGEVSAAVAASATSARCRKSRRSSAQFVGGASDSDCSDESGYVEYQASERSPRPMTVNESGAKPQLPPKPMTRRITGVGTTTMV